MHSQSIISGVLRPLLLSSSRRCALGSPQIIHSGIFQISAAAIGERVPTPFLSFVGAASDQIGMAETVLSKPHRFILVSDLDWTMVRVACLVSLTCMQTCLITSNYSTQLLAIQSASQPHSHIAGGPQ